MFECGTGELHDIGYSHKNETAPKTAGQRRSRMMHTSARCEQHFCLFRSTVLLVNRSDLLGNGCTVSHHFQPANKRKHITARRTCLEKELRREPEQPGHGIGPPTSMTAPRPPARRNILPSPI